ncbi:MAG TPA: transketolase [Opitutaceae bacterium]|nr:transketolase [Opitutaceae bacterium]
MGSLHSLRRPLTSPRSSLPSDSPALAARLRRHAIEMCRRAKASHVGAILSMADILAVLYARILQVRPTEPKWACRDRFILSKGHAGAGVYAVLAECGFFPLAKLETHYQNGSDLSGHVSHLNVPGVELSTGSLGHGLPVGQGMALAAKLDGKTHRVFVLISDGECDEGSNWEAVLFASHHRLSNLVAIVDYNKIQSLASVSETIALEPLADKWRAFGWEVAEVDGHDHEALFEALRKRPAITQPLCVIAHTTKGKGVSFMENSVLWHYRSPQGEEYEAAIKELDQSSHA